MKNTMLLIGLWLLCSVALAEPNQNAGQYGYKFLTVPYGPASIALAGRGVHTTGNPYAFITQPAAACELDQRIIGISHSPWLVDTQANILSYSYARRVDHFGIAIRNLNYGEVENRDDTGFLIGYYNPLDVDIMANYAYRISPNVYVGINLGALYQKLNTATSLGLHGDFGFSVLPPFSGSKLSVAVRNLGNATKTNEETVRFPSSLEADISQTIKLGEQSLSLGAAGVKLMDEDLKGSISLEVELLKLLKLRCGYKLNYDAESFSAGFGVSYQKLSVDYGYVDFNNDLTDVHSFGVGYQF